MPFSISSENHQERGSISKPNKAMLISIAERNVVMDEVADIFMMAEFMCETLRVFLLSQIGPPLAVIAYILAQKNAIFMDKCRFSFDPIRLIFHVFAVSVLRSQ